MPGSSFSADDKNALYILIQAVDNASPTLKKLREEGQKAGKILSDVGDSGARGANKAKSAFFDWFKTNRGAIRDIQMLRMTILRMAGIVGLVIGPIVAGFKEMDGAIKLSREANDKLGMSFSELAQKMYGVKLTKDDVRRVDEFKDAWAGVVQKVKGLTVKVASDFLAGLEIERKAIQSLLHKVPGLKNVVSDPNDAKQAQKSTELYRAEEIQFIMQLETKTKAFYKDKYTLQKEAVRDEITALKNSLDITETSIEKKKDMLKALTNYEKAAIKEIDKARMLEATSYEAQMAKMQGNLTRAQELEYRIQRENAKKQGDENLKIWEEYYQKVQELERLHTVGLRTLSENWIGSVQGFTSSAEAGFTNLFELAFTGNLRNARQAWDTFINALNQSIIQFLAQETTRRMFGGLITQMAFGGFGGPVGAVNKTTGTWTSPSGQAFNARGSSLLTLGDGGIVTKPTIAMIGERGPEAVVPLNKVGSSGGGVTNVTINAVDSKSFVDMLSQHSNELGTIFNNNVLGNKSSRRVVRGR